jgi:putative tricarboxylic transport membrane protein
MSIRIFGVVIFVIATLYTWNAGSYAITFGDVLGPTVFPVIVGIPMMILSASLVVFPSGQVDWPAPQRMWRQAAALAVLIGYTIVLRPLGFPLATFALIALLGIILGGAAWKAVLLGAIMAPALWALFDQVLGLPLDFLGSLFG